MSSRTSPTKSTGAPANRTSERRAPTVPSSASRSPVTRERGNRERADAILRQHRRETEIATRASGSASTQRTHARVKPTHARVKPTSNRAIGAAPATMRATPSATGERSHGTTRSSTARGRSGATTQTNAFARHTSRGGRRPLQKRVRKVRRTKPSMFRAGDPRRRLLAVFSVVAVVFTAVLVRVGLLQTASASSYIAAGAAQRTSESKLRADRGVIFDRNGADLALSVPAMTVWLNPKLVVDSAQTIASLTALLQLTPEKQQSLLAAIASREKGFAYVKRQIDDTTAAAVMALNLAGVDTYRENTRVVPGGELARGVIGKTDTDGIGTGGLELQYNALLTGTDGEVVRERDQQGRSIPGSGATKVQPVPGQDLVLTIDRSIQFAVEQALFKRVSEIGAKGGTAIVEAVNGDILAMASVRLGEDNVYHVASSNVAAVDAYEPGSVAKVITIAAGLNEGLVTPETTLVVPGKRTFNKDATNKDWIQTITDAHAHGTMPMTVHEILVESSNNGTVLVSEKLKAQKQWEYMTAFGLGQRSALGFPGESVGILRPWQEWRGTEKITPSYGYGVASTAIQLVGAVNVIANNGVYVAPRLVLGTLDGAGNRVDAPAPESHMVVKPEVAQQMNTIMRDVVCNGTATAAQIDGLTIAGKTGTGVKAGEHGYAVVNSEKKYFASFVGFFPAEKPAVTLLISIDEPPAGTQDRFGGKAAAPVFQAVVPTIMHQLGLQPPTATGGCPKK